MEENTVTTETPSEGQKTFTQEEVTQLLQQEGDRRVSQARKTWEQKKEKEISEAIKLSQMSEQDRHIAELQKREEALEERERAYQLLENKNAASQILAERGLSIKLADFVLAEDAETMKSNIDLLEMCFKQSVKEEVEKRIKTSQPKINLPVEGMTKEAFRKLSIAERQAFKNSNPLDYNKFVN